MDVLGHDGEGVITVIRRLSGEQLKHHRAQRVHVTANIATLSLNLFRRHVIGCSKRRCEGRGRDLGRAFEKRRSEVHQLDLAGLCDEDVVRLDVAVNDAEIVTVVQRFAQLGAERDRLIY